MSTSTRPFESLRPGSGAMFDRIAGRYDLVNRIMTFGLDNAWRRRTVRSLELRSDGKVLDLATGTASLALEIARIGKNVQVIGVDPSEEMLAVGRKKVAHAGLEGRIRLEQGKAEALPFEDAAFDGVSIGYGIRNVADRRASLREMARVTRPGGRIAILEATDVKSGIFAPFTRFYVRRVMPRLGALLSRADEYRYLQTSIAAFPDAEAFTAMMEEEGLRVLKVHSMTFGANTLFIATPAGGER